MIRRFLQNGRLEHSLAVSTALLVILVIVTTIGVVHARLKLSLLRGLEARGGSIAQSIGALARPSLLAYNYAALQVAAQGAVEDPDLLYVVIHDKEGVVAGRAGAAGAPEELAAPLTEPISRELSLPGHAGHPALRALEVGVPVRVEGSDRPWGSIRVGLSYHLVTEELQRTELGLSLLGLLLAVIAVVSGRWMARRITAPLRRLAEGTEALSSGNTAHRIPVSGARELAELARAFNAMVDRLQEKAAESSAYQDALAKLNATLEQQVHQRTQALEESEAQYRTLVEHSPDSIVIVQDGHVRFVNRGFEETFGIRAAVALDPQFSLLAQFEPGSSAAVAERIAAWQRGEAAGATEVLAHNAAGSPLELQLRGSRIEYRGRPAAECLLVDMTEAKRLRERLAHTERLRALGELAGGVAHDFNNLIGAILGRVQLLRRRGFEVEIDRELCVIEKAAQDGRETVRRIQEFSRTRKDRPFAPVDLPEILRDAMEITRTRWKADAERRNINIHTFIDCEPVPPILGHPTELREVFTNLILNAVDAMPQGGKLWVRCHTEDGKVLAEVEDSGVGMTEEIRRHVFDPFFTTKGQSGNGLGMSVAYGIVTRHQGTIEALSRLGHGTRFVLEFPACPHAAPPRVAEPADPPRPP
ncbi:MAG TPA: ATP-binding protein, partial [Candidatus Polarisedimenticolaceae bacterium]|nr:ATP-binding protein [Candidatus Polarisedimenticolaceae bacterium]